MRPTRSLRFVALSALLAHCAGSRSVAPPPAPVTQPQPAPVAVPDSDVPAPLANGRLPAGVRPVRYALDLSVDPRQPEFSGTVTITLALDTPRRAIVLHARDLTVDSATLHDSAGDVTATATLRNGAGTHPVRDELVVVGARPVSGEATLTLRYHGPFATNLDGLYRVHVGDDWYAFTDFEPNGARKAFPCFDEPGFKVPWSVRLRTPRGVPAFANMPDTGHADGENDTTAWTFADTPAQPTYLVAFVVGPFDVHNGPTQPVPVRVLAPRGRGALGAIAAETAAAHLNILSEYFDHRFPWPKLDLVAVPDFMHGAMENPGLITFREALLLLDPQHASTGARRAMASVTAHELAHQWFGNLVTMSWWDDLWLNEGFANWMGPRVVHRWRPDLRGDIDSLGDRTWARTVDALPTAHAIRAPIASTSDALAAFDSTTYSKGASVIAMIEDWMGETAFRDGIRRYLRAHEWGNATADQLLGELDAVTELDVNSVARSFLDQAGLPLISLRMQCTAGSAPSVTLSQTRFVTRGEAGDTRWSVPVCMRFQAAPRAVRQCVLLTERESTVALNTRACPRWITPHDRAAGHYWYQMEPSAYSALLTDRQALNTVERLDLFSDLEALLGAGRTEVTVWLDVLDRLLTDPDPEVSERAAGALFNIERYYVTDATRPAFQRWIRARLTPRVRAAGWRPVGGDLAARNRFPRVAIAALGYLGDDPAVLAEATRHAQRFLADPTTVDSDIASTAVPLASRRANAAHFDALLNALGTARTPQDRNLILASLGSFEDPALLRRALELGLDPRVRASDLRNLFRVSSHVPALRVMLAEWMVERFPAIRERWGDSARAVFGLAGGLCETAAIERTATAMRSAVDSIEGQRRGFDETLSYARRCVDLRTRHSEAVGRWLAARR